jgi:hypothetical protein
VFSRQQSKLDRMKLGTTPQKAMIGDLGAVVDIDMEDGWRYKS